MFAHEYGHDLGLPDHYDTSGPAAPTTAVNWWTLMAQSRSSAPGDQGIGTRAADLGAWDKLQLGWLDYEIVVAGQDKHARPRPARVQQQQGPGRRRGAAEEAGRDHRSRRAAAGHQVSGGRGAGDDLNNSLTRTVTLPAGTATLSFQARWDIEDCGPDACDYAYVEVDDGTGYKAIAGTITNAAEGNGIDGDQRGLGAGDVRPVRLRRQDGRPAVPLLHRRRAQGRAASPASSSTTSR